MLCRQGETNRKFSEISLFQSCKWLEKSQCLLCPPLPFLEQAVFSSHCLSQHTTTASPSSPRSMFCWGIAGPPCAMFWCPLEVISSCLWSAREKAIFTWMLMLLWPSQWALCRHTWRECIRNPDFPHVSLLFIFPLEHPHLISAQENCTEKCFLRPSPFQNWHYQFGIFTGLLGIRKRDGCDCTAPFKPNPNTSPDLVQPIRKGNLAPGEDRVWSLHLAGQSATSEWAFQMQYSVTKSSWRC